nr:reverse transcriptase domain-containing protein [Tanacetum cinerariifolium]
MNTKEHDKRHRSRRSRSLRTSVFSRIRLKRSRSPIKREWSRSPRQRAKEGGVFKRLRSRGKSVSARSDSYNQHSHSRYTEALSESEDSRDPFTLRIRYFDFPKTRMPSNIKTYDGSEDVEDHLKIFQAAAKIERWAMPTWGHMFYSTFTGNARVWFDDLSSESIDSYDDQKKAFLENYIQQKKYIEDPIELHNIKQRDGKFTEDFVRRSKLESRDVKGASECMGIFGFVHGSTNPELIKRLHDKIPKMVDEMMRVTTSFLRGELAASNHERKKSFPPWKQHEGNRKQNFKKGGFRSQQMSKRKQDHFSLLTKTPKEIFALEKGNFNAPPPMTTPVEKRNYAKFCEFYGEVGHNTDECMHLRKQIEEMLKAGKLSHLIKEIKQNNGKEQPKEDEGTKGPMIIEAEIGGRCVHRMYVDDRSASEIMYEHCFSRLRPKIKIGDEEHYALAWMNVMVVRSQSPYNGIIRRPGVRKLQAVPSTAHGMLKIPVERNLDIFAWKPADMTGVPRHIAKHRLNVREGCSPVRQKKKEQAADRNQAI